MKPKILNLVSICHSVTIDISGVVCLCEQSSANNLISTVGLHNLYSGVRPITKKTHARITIYLPDAVKIFWNDSWTDVLVDQEFSEVSANFARFDDYIVDDSYQDVGVTCAMCGKERSLNGDGYCSTCWTVWNS